jgi:hypothetical protein
MAREIVTSENKAEHDARKMGKKPQKYTEHGLPINEKGHVRLFHGTSKDSAQKILKEKMLKSAGEPDVYFTTHPSGTGYGDTTVAVDVPHHLLNLDDEFPNGRMDFRVPTKNKMLPIYNPEIVKTSD